jgi:hypothetical protein
MIKVKICEPYVVPLLKWGTYTIDVPNLVTYLNQTPMFEWCVVRCISINGYQNDTCVKDSGLCAQNMRTILGSIVNIIMDMYDHLMSTENLHFSND